MVNCLFESPNEIIELISEKVAEKLLAKISNDKELKEGLQKGMDLNKYLNASELADYLGVTRQTIHNWNKDSKISSILYRFSKKTGNKTLYDPVGLEKAIWTYRLLFKKHVSYFQYYDHILEDDREVKRWTARIAIKKKLMLELTEQETKFNEAFKKKVDDKTQKPDIYRVK